VTAVVTNEHRPNIIVNILGTALATNGATPTRLTEKSYLTEYPEKLKMYLSILESHRLIAYHKGDRVFRTTYKGMRFLRTFNHTIDLLSNL
jgi:predicted transcriptional regulator